MTKVDPVGSEASFEVFYAATAQGVFNSVRRAAGGDKHVAHDAVQDAYLVMWERWAERAPHPAAENRRYLTGIAYHKLADIYRSRDRFGDLDGTEPGGSLDTREMDAVVTKLSLHQAVRDLLTAQPPRRRLVGVLFFLEDHKYDEIAAMLDLAPSTVRTHVDRLRQQLRRLVDRLAEIERGGEQS